MSANDEASAKSNSVTAAPDLIARGSKMHRLHCHCCVCESDRRRVALGIPSKSEQRALRRQQREQARAERQKAQSQRRSLMPRNAYERRLVKQTALESALVGQVTAGGRPNIAQAAKIAGMDPSQAAKIARREGSIEAALSRAGITDDSLSSLAREGMEATETRLVIQDGKVVDAVATPDYHARHKYWRDVLMMKGHLGADKDGAGGVGGLTIVVPTVTPAPGHIVGCTCRECCDAWEKQAQQVLARHRRAAEMDALPEPFDGDEDKEH